MNKNVKNALKFTTGTAALAAMILALIVSQYGSPDFNQSELDDARKQLAQADNYYERAREYAIAEAGEESELKQINAELKDLEFWQNAYPDAERAAALKRIDELENKKCDIISDKLNNSVDVARAIKNRIDLKSQIAQLQRDSLAHAEFKKRTMSEKWNNVWCDFHTGCIAAHQKRLQRLQKTK